MGIEEELQSKIEELAVLQQSYDEFVESSKELEAELEHQLQEAQHKIDEIEKKQNDTESKYRLLQENWNQLSKENKTIQNEIQKLKEKVMTTETTKRTLENENEELSNQVRILEATEEDLKHKLLNAEEDIVYLKTDIEELKASKQQLEESIRQHKDINLVGSNDDTSPKPDFGVDTDAFNVNVHGGDMPMRAEKSAIISGMEEKVNQLSNTIEILEEENQKLQEKLKETMEQLDQQQEDRMSSDKMADMIYELQLELEGERQRIEQKDFRLVELEKEKEELADENRQLQDLKSDAQRLEAEQFALKEKEEAVRHELIQSHQSALKNLESMLKTKSNELMLLRNALSSAEKSFSDQKETMNSVLQQQIDSLTADLISQREYADTLLEEKDLLFHSLSGMKLLMEEKDKEIEELQDTIGKNQSFFEQEKQRVGQGYDQQLEVLENQIRDLKIAPTNNISNAAHSSEEFQAHLDEIVALRAMLLDKEEECNQKVLEIQQLQETITKLEEEYKLEKASVMREMTEKLDAVMSEFAKQKEDGMENRTCNSSDRASIGSHISLKDVYSGRFDSTTSTMKNLQQVLAGNDTEKLKKELVGLAEYCESLKTNNIKLLNKIQAVRGNILVCCRTRPPNENEINAGGVVIVDASDDTELLCYDGRSESWKSFAFDRVWKCDSNQADIFSDIEPLVMSVTDGYNSCIMAYGQTGSGKTYTMDGYDEQYGVSYRTIQKIFDILEGKKNQLYMSKYKNGKGVKMLSPYSKAHPSPDNSSKRRKSATTEFTNSRKPSLVAVDDSSVDDGHEDHDNSSYSLNSTTSYQEPDLQFKYWVELSMMEIYNEQVYDLLNDTVGGGQTDGAPLDIRQAPDNTVSVPGLKQVPVANIDDVMLVFSKGSSNRATAATNMNERSSRSHLIIQVEVTIEQEGESQTKGKLFLVDLAGSERVGKSGATGTTMKEAQYINKSLLALGDVMEALDQKQKHIPYRNSKLTFLLQNALGGSARTMMIVTVCPTDLTFEETLFTLQFATRVRNITLGAAQRNSNSKNLEICVKNLKSELKEAKRKKSSLEDTIQDLKREQKKAQERSTGPLEARVKLLEESKKSLELVVNQIQRQLNDALVRLHEEREAKESLRSDLEMTQRNLKKALEQAKDHVLESERFSVLLKNKERELESVRAALSRHVNSGGKGVGTPSTAEKQAKVAFHLNNNSGNHISNGNGNEKYHPRLESEISTPLHAVKKTRFDDDFPDPPLPFPKPLQDDLHSTSSSHEDGPQEVTNREVMGPPPPIVDAATKLRSSRGSSIPTVVTRLSSGSNSGNTSGTKGRVSIDSVFKTNTPTTSTSTRITSTRPGFNSSSASSLTIKKTTGTKMTTPQTYGVNSNSTTPATPNARLQSDAPPTPNAPNVIPTKATVSAAPAVSVVEKSANPPGSLVSRIPTVAARSEEALKRHQMRMEKRRSAAETKK